MRQPARRWPQGTKRQHGKIGQAYDPPIAPMLKGKSHGLGPCGRPPGRLSAPPAGVIFACAVPVGHPPEPSAVFPLLDKVQPALTRVSGPPTPSLPAVAGALGSNDAALRQALHARGMLRVGIPKTVEPRNPKPRPAEMLALLNEAGVHRTRTPSQGQGACAGGDSRPVVERPIASVRTRGAGQIRSQGPQGAVVQRGRTVMAHNAAALVRIRQQRRSKRAQTFRRLLGLRCRHVKQISDSKI